MKSYTFEHVTIHLTEEQDQEMRRSQKDYRKFCIENGLGTSLYTDSYMQYLESNMKVALSDKINEWIKIRGE